MLFNQWWTQTSDATFLQRVQAKRTRDFPQDFVDPATPPEPSTKTPRSQELPLQGSSSQATTRAAEAAEKRRQDAWTRGGIAVIVAPERALLRQRRRPTLQKLLHIEPRRIRLFACGRERRNSRPLADGGVARSAYLVPCNV